MSSPQAIAAAASQIDALASDVEYVRFYWNDLSSIPRARAVPRSRVADALHDGHAFTLGISDAWAGLLPNDSFIGASAAGESRLVPDWGSLRLGPRAGHASVQCFFYSTFPSASSLPSSSSPPLSPPPSSPSSSSSFSVVSSFHPSPSPLCPRSALVAALASANGCLDGMRIGFELEFMILTPTLATEYQGSWSYARALDSSYASRVLEPALRSLAAAAIPVEQWHAEAAQCQYEIVLAHRPPLEAVDNLLHAREILRATAAAAGLVLTFHPKVNPAWCGSGCHMHLSLGPALDAHRTAYEAFYAGVLRDLPAMMALAYASPASYQRMQENLWAGGTVVAWGTQDKEAALRKIADSHWEIKTLDGLANPYLALAAVVTAGLRGYRDGLVLDLADSAQKTAPEKTPHQTDLPRSLDAALDCFAASDLAGCMNSQLVQAYLAVKRAEVEFYSRMEPREMLEFICKRY